MPKDRQAKSVFYQKREREMCEMGIKWSLSIKLCAFNGGRKRKRQKITGREIE